VRGLLASSGQRWKRRQTISFGVQEALADHGTQILKFLVHLSKEEQLTRFTERLDDPNHNWKISESDYTERDSWDAYMAAYEDAISAARSKRGPWFVIPANHKWFRNLAVSQIIADAMEELDMSYPKATVDLADIRRRYHAAVDNEEGDKKRHGR
jgi:polyphosphate kinase 2 (PPK2 family)